MKTLMNISAKLRSEKGVVLVYVAILLVVFLGMAALAVDIGYVMVSKNELQNAADAAALAGARRLGENYKDSVSPVSTNVLDAAQTTAYQNKATKLNLEAGNVVASYGIWDPTSAPNNIPFPSNAIYPDAVKATVNRKDGTPGGAVGTFFAPIFKLIDPSFKDKLPVEATACAAITGPCIWKPGIPLGISKDWFATHPGDGEACGPVIKLNDTGDSCAGWTNLSTNTNQIKQDVSDLLTGKTAMPLVTVGGQVQFIGGNPTGLTDDLLVLFNKMRVLNDPAKGDADNNSSTWTTFVAVYEAPCGQNPNKAYTILGFAMLSISKVEKREVTAKVVCGMAEAGRERCKAFGSFFQTIPGLVQ